SAGVAEVDLEAHEAEERAGGGRAAHAGVGVEVRVRLTRAQGSAGGHAQVRRSPRPLHPNSAVCTMEYVDPQVPGRSGHVVGDRVEGDAAVFAELRVVLRAGVHRLRLRGAVRARGYEVVEHEPIRVPRHGALPMTAA